MCLETVAPSLDQGADFITSLSKGKSSEENRTLAPFCLLSSMIMKSGGD